MRISDTYEKLKKLGLVVMSTAGDDDEERVLEIRKRGETETGLVLGVVGQCRNDTEVGIWLDGFEHSTWRGDDKKDDLDVVERLKHHGFVLVDGGGDRVFEIRKQGRRPRSDELVRRFLTKREVEVWLDGFETER